MSKSGPDPCEVTMSTREKRKIPNTKIYYKPDVVIMLLDIL